MTDKKKKGNASKGFASETPEAREKRLAKSLATRRANKKKREANALKARELRVEADSLIKEAERLREEADKLDGSSSSEKAQKKYEAEITKKITEEFGRSVSPQYLKQMIGHAILRKTRVENIVTPTYAAMDILNDPTSSKKEIQDAIKMLQQFESAKPAVVEDDSRDTVGSVQEEMDKLFEIHSQIAPKS